jgi:hypothetical protein
MKNYGLVLTSIVCAVVFAGCSSGGGDSAAQTVSGVQLSGAISKGIVVDGPVTVEELDSAANAIAVVGTARTGNDGSYQLTLGDNYTGGVLQVTISADDNTRMKCDIPLGCGTRTDGLTDPNSNSTIDFGEFYKPSELSMTALLPGAVANAVVNASATPFTHMAAELAKSKSVFDSAAVANANSEVSNLLGGLDILNIVPIDITDATAVDNALSPTQITYAALLAAIAIEAGTDADGQPLINEVLDLLASSFTSGTILADDSTGDDTAQISLQEIVTSAETVFTAVGIVDVTGVLVELQQDILTAVNNIVDPEPSPTVADANLDKVKAMMSDIRTWGNVIIAEAGTQASTFEAEVVMASDAVGILGTNAFDALVAGIDAALLFDGNTDLSTYILDPVTDPNPRQFSSGTIGVSSGAIVITDGVIDDYTVNMTVTVPADGTTDTVFNLAVTSATVTGIDSDLSITNGTVNVTLAEAYTIIYASPNPLPAVADLLADLPNASFTQKLDSSGQALASPVTFTGTMQVDLDPIPVTNVSVPGDATVLVLPKTLQLTGTISNNSGDSLNATLAANVTNTDSFAFVGDFASVGTPYSDNHVEPFASWTYSDTDATPGDDTFTATYPGFWSNVYWDANTGYATLSVSYISYYYSYPTFEPVGSLDEALVYFGSSGLGDIYVWVENEGMYFASTAAADFSMDGTLEGTLADPEFIIENANQWIDADIGLTFGLQLTDLPAASVNINADRTDFRTGNGSITISYGSRQIEITAAVNAENIISTDYSGSVTITNQDGVKVVLDSLVLSSDQLSGVLLYTGIQYGTIEITPTGFLKVSYVDGTFEIF